MRIRTRLRKIKRLLPKSTPVWSLPMAFVSEDATDAEIDAAVANARAEAGDPPLSIPTVVYQGLDESEYDAAIAERAEQDGGEL